MMEKKIRVLVAEDSTLVQRILTKIFDNDPLLEVVGVAKNGKIAVDMARRLKPDVITMDIRMPVMDGFQATRIIMSEIPTPILVVSSSVRDDDLKISFNAIQAGALDIMEKPRGNLAREYYEVSEEIIKKIKLIADIKVFRHLAPKYHLPVLKKERPLEKTRRKAVAIGASTGGPSALFQLLTSLTPDFPAPIFVTQHISEGFGRGCVEWIEKNSRVPVTMAGEGEHIQPGTVYFAPDDRVMSITSRHLISVEQEKMPRGFRPIDRMMDSFAGIYGRGGVGVLLTGMGDDGARGMKEISETGGKTIVQDEESSVVFGMPKAAINLGAADEVLPLGEIAGRIVDHLAGDE